MIYTYIFMCICSKIYRRLLAQQPWARDKDVQKPREGDNSGGVHIHIHIYTYKYACTHAFKHTYMYTYMYDIQVFLYACVFRGLRPEAGNAGSRGDLSHILSFVAHTCARLSPLPKLDLLKKRKREREMYIYILYGGIGK